MLRPLLVALLLANAALLAANLGWLDSLRSATAPRQREPERLARQLNPTALQLLPADGQASAPARGAAQAAAQAAAQEANQAAAQEPTQAAPASAASSASASASAALALSSTPAPGGTCLQAGPFAADSLAAAEQVLQAAGVPAGAWQLLAGSGVAPATAPINTLATTTWLIVMGRYADAQVLARKQEELRRLKVDVSTLSGSASLPPGVAPGLLLGRFSERSAADQALAALVQRGVNTARVVAFQPGQSALPVLLQVPGADVDLQRRLAALALPAGQVWTACAPLPAPPAADALPPGSPR